VEGFYVPGRSGELIVKISRRWEMGAEVAKRAAGFDPEAVARAPLDNFIAME